LFKSTIDISQYNLNLIFDTILSKPMRISFAVFMLISSSYLSDEIMQGVKAITETDDDF
jgi:hypothetical protein